MRKIFPLLVIVLLSWQVMAQNVGQEGDTLRNYIDINGFKQGYWKKNYDNGNPRFEAYFVDDKPVGTMKRWDSYGNLFALLAYDAKGEKAKVFFYHKNGKMAATGNYLGKEKDSIWLYYSETNQLYLQESYSKGIKDGFFRNYTSEGLLLEEVQWKNGNKHGVWKKFYPQGGALMWEATYNEDKLEGEAKSYFENGKVYKEGKFVNDLMEGTWMKYNENGGIEKVYHYTKGVSPEAEKEDDAMMKELLDNKEKFEGPKSGDDLDWLRQPTGRN
ncbi:MAG: hypothetical protein M0P66_10105 [Salinivirgaceae bacterium]|nr:hypothetical protein [Salinivirgaceae bacterium]